MQRVLNSDSFDNCDAITTKYDNPENCGFKYMETLRNPKTTRQQLSKMEKEMIDLRGKIYDILPDELYRKRFLDTVLDAVLDFQARNVLGE